MKIFTLMGKNLFPLNLVLNQIEFYNNVCSIEHFVDFVLYCLNYLGWRKNNMAIFIYRLHHLLA